VTPRSTLLRKTSTGWLAHAPAKINLYLDVQDRRDDGYHDLETLIAPISLFDTLHVAPAPAGDRSISIEVIDCAQQSAGRPAVTCDAPADDTNLIVRALRQLQSRLGVAAGARVKLYKRTPIQAGLGGGSSDAAAALLAGQRLWRNELPPDELVTLAADIGSDVPAMLAAGATICRGRGERVEPTPLPAGIACVLAQPPVGLGAGEVFGEYEPPIKSTGGDGDRLENLLSALRRSQLGQVGQWMLNGLQAPAEQRLSERGANWLQRLRDAFGRLPVAAHQMTGSGSVYFGLCLNWRAARQAAARLRSLSWKGQPLGWVGVAGTL